MFERLLSLRYNTYFEWAFIKMLKFDCLILYPSEIFSVLSDFGKDSLQVSPKKIVKESENSPVKIEAILGLTREPPCETYTVGTTVVLEICIFQQFWVKQRETKCQNWSRRAGNFRNLGALRCFQQKFVSFPCSGWWWDMVFWDNHPSFECRQNLASSFSSTTC